jgi:hypothetical protein
MSWVLRRRRLARWLPVRMLRKCLLWLALGPRTYRYMAGTVRADKRCRNARMVDIVVRKDAVERRIEADWVKTIAQILDPQPPLITAQTPPGPPTP